ncbi:MAG TPA: glycosyltransferase family 2 protein [Spirochaetota bacterium]|nr:glycosyltransferase family 2 protein [Spirochaetota bacterium]
MDERQDTRGTEPATYRAYPSETERKAKTTRTGGRRRRGVEKHSTEESPLVTVVTVVLNGAKYLREAIQSVIGQDYENVEYIVVDGGSTDSTLDIIESYDEDIDLWISESDSGVYHAMNKAIGLGRGELFFFLNSDDYFMDKRIISNVVSVYKNDRSLKLIYGNVFVFNPETKHGVSVGRPISLADLKSGKTICHQALFIGAEPLKEKSFDLKYGIAADFDFICRWFGEYPSRYLNKTFALYRLGGLSSNPDGVAQEAKEIIRTHFGNYAYRKYIVLYKLKFVRKILRKILLTTGLLERLYSLSLYKKVMRRIDY